MNIVWAEIAVSDLVAIRQFIADHNPGAANSVALKILHSVNFLEDKPLLGMRTHVDGVRRLIVKQSPYSIIYRISGNDVQVLEVFDGRRFAPRTDVRV